MLKRTSPYQGHFDPFFITPMDVIIKLGTQLLDRYPEPIAVVEHLVLQPAEKAPAGRIVRRAAFLRHRPDRFCIIHSLDPARPTALAAPIGMDQWVLIGFQRLHRRIQQFIDSF